MSCARREIPKTFVRNFKHASMCFTCFRPREHSESRSLVPAHLWRVTLREEVADEPFSNVLKVLEPGICVAFVSMRSSKF